MWSRGDLFFETPDQHIMAAAYTVKGDSLVAGKPRLWSEKPIGGTGGTKKVLKLVSAKAPGERILGPDNLTTGLESGRLHAVLKFSLPG